MFLQATSRLDLNSLGRFQVGKQYLKLFSCRLWCNRIKKRKGTIKAVSQSKSNLPSQILGLTLLIHSLEITLAIFTLLRNFALDSLYWNIALRTQIHRIQSTLQQKNNINIKEDLQGKYHYIHHALYWVASSSVWPHQKTHQWEFPRAILPKALNCTCCI